MRDYAILRFDAPQMFFGAAHGNWFHGEQDFVSQKSDGPGGLDFFPSRSMLTGLLGNALGYERYEGDRLQDLADRMRFAAGLTKEGEIVADFQTAQLGANDRGWTTRGQPQGRRGGAATYDSPHLARKGAWARTEAVVALRLDGADMDAWAIGAALTRPERPLFVGRKAYLPSLPIFRGVMTAPDAYTAIGWDLSEEREYLTELFWGVIWDRGEGPTEAPLAERDERRWMVGVHGGGLPMHYRLPPPFYDYHIG